MDAAADAAPVGKGGWSRCGAELREARERLGWDLGEIAGALRIKTAYLQAIEDGRLKALPGNAYALGFLRAYATALGLDADDLARRFRTETAEVNRKPELAFPAPVPERGIPTGATVLLGLLVAVVAYVGWFRFSEHERAPTRTVPPVPARLLPAHRPASVSPQVASVMPASPGAFPPVPATAPERGSNPSATGAAPATASVPPASRAVPAPAAPTGAPPSAPEKSASQPAGATVPPAGAATTLVATEPSWVQVRAADGEIIYDHVLAAGERWTVPAGSAGLLLTTGNAGGLSIDRGGVSTGPLGRDGAVMRRLPLDQPVATAPAASDPGADRTAPSASVPASPAVGATSGAVTGTAPDGTAAGTTPPIPKPAARRPVRHRAAAPSTASSSPDDSADALNARELGGHPASPRR